MKRALQASIFLLFAAFFGGCSDTYGPDEPRRAGVHSFEFQFNAADASLDASGLVASAQYDAPSITRSVVDHGAVLVYFRKFDTWTAMPYTYGVESPTQPAVDYTLTLGYAFERNFLEVFYESSTAEVNPRAQPSYRIKVVVIDELGHGKRPIDLRNYEEVKAYYGLTD